MTDAKPQSSIYTGYVHPVAFLSTQNATTLRTAPSQVRHKHKLRSNLHSHVFYGLFQISLPIRYQILSSLSFNFFGVCCMYADIDADSSMEAVAKWPVYVVNGWLHQLSSHILIQIIPSKGSLV